MADLVAVGLLMTLAAFAGWIGARVALRQVQVTVYCVHGDPVCQHHRPTEERVN
jgi:hypothetical protein